MLKYFDIPGSKYFHYLYLVVWMLSRGWVGLSLSSWWTGLPRREREMVRRRRREVISLLYLGQDWQRPGGSLCQSYCSSPEWRAQSLRLAASPTDSIRINLAGLQVRQTESITHWSATNIPMLVRTTVVQGLWDFNF